MTTFDREIEALRAKRDRAVTRPEVERLVGGGTGGPSDWASITGKPSTFAPSPHVHAASDITDLTEVVQDIVAALLVQGSGVTLTYNDAAGTLTVAASGGGLADGDKGDITVSGSGATWTIDANAVSLSKLATMATDSLLGRDTAGTGNVEVLSPSQVRVILNVADGATANSADATLLARANHTGTQLAASISDFASAVAALITGKQDTLVSGTTIKTVNGNSLLGSGNLVISGSGLAGTATVTPALASNEWRETVAAVGVTGSSKIICGVGVHSDTDENDPEFLDIGAISAIPGTDTLTFVMNFLTPTQGPIKLNWSAF